jgi:cytochrome c553
MRLMQFCNWHFKFTLLLGALMVFANLSIADSIAGKQKSATCTACHGPMGISSNNLWPNLAGQKEQYLSKQLHDFRAGSRIDPLMGPVSKMLSDQDVADLAAYFSRLQGANP